MFISTKLLIAAVLFSFVSRGFCEYNLSIIHFNDFHARYEAITNASGLCKAGQANCIGGFSRLFASTKKLVQTRPNAIFLNAGDNFQGSLWYNVHKWNVTQHFLNKMPLDAITLGNHEFDDQIDGLVPFLEHVRAPVIVSNIDDSKEPRLKGLYRKNIVLDREGRKIGIIGVILSTTNLVSNTGNLSFLDESESVNAEAQKLIKTENVFTNIVLSHCGYEKDLEIARNSTSKISVIVGGHTDTFLYSGEPSPGPDKASGPYPTVVKNQMGKSVLVVQASAHGKYVGNLTVVYGNDDSDGYPISWSGAPIFMDETVPTDKDIDDELNKWGIEVDAKGNEIIGRSLFPMLNKPCRAEECILGNFVTNAMVFWYITDEDYENDSWSETAIAIFHAGGMRESIGRGNITFKDLAVVFPFEDTIDLVEIKGEHLKEIFETTVDDRHLMNPHLIQSSGIKLVFNISKLEGNRISSFKVRCRECPIPCYKNLEPARYYRLALPGFLTNTQFNPLFKKYTVNKRVGPRDTDVYAKYLTKRSPVFEEIEGKIVFTS